MLGAIVLPCKQHCASEYFFTDEQPLETSGPVYVLMPSYTLANMVEYPESVQERVRLWSLQVATLASS
jgi:hypothetical protein